MRGASIVVVVDYSGLAMGSNKKVAIVTGANTGIGRCNLRFIWFFLEYFGPPVSRFSEIVSLVSFL